MRATPNGQFSSDSAQIAGGHEDLQSLADQMSDIASQISRMVVVEQADEKLPQHRVDAAMLRRMMRARRARAEFFTPGLFGDPAWDMLLDLFVSHLTHVRVAVTSLCAASNVPATTALRWIKTLEDDGLAVRRPDMFDGRRSFIELSENGEQAMERYFSHIGHNIVI